MRVANPNNTCGKVVSVFRNNKIQVSKRNFIRFISSTEISINNDNWKCRIDLMNHSGNITKDELYIQLSEVQYKIVCEEKHTVLFLNWTINETDLNLSGLYHVLCVFNTNRDLNNLINGFEILNI